MQLQQKQLTSAPGGSEALGPCAYQFTASNTGSWRILRPQVNDAACIGCGVCGMYCPADVVRVDKARAPKVEFLWDYCKGCGICANECPKHCIAMVPERSGE